MNQKVVGFSNFNSFYIFAIIFQLLGVSDLGRLGDLVILEVSDSSSLSLRLSLSHENTLEFDKLHLVSSLEMIESDFRGLY